MDTPPIISIITAIIFILALIATGTWLAIKGRYHIFYFSLLGLFVLSFILKILSFKNKLFSSSSVQYDYANTSQPYVPSQPDFFSSPEFHCFLSFAHINLILLFGVLSLVNPFIRKNKLAVRIVSGIMLLGCSVLAVITYFIFNWISDFAKMGG